MVGMVVYLDAIVAGQVTQTKSSQRRGLEFAGQSLLVAGEQWLIWRKEGDEEVDLYYPVFMTVRWEAQVDNRRFFLFSLLNLYLEVHFSSKFY